jgi:hypothetical protein
VGQVAAEFFVELDGIAARASLLGASITVTRLQAQLRIEFPPAADKPFRPNAGHVGQVTTGDQVPDPRDYDPFATPFLGPRRDSLSADSLVEIRLVRIVINQSSRLSAKDFDSQNQEQVRAHDQTLFGMHDLALTLASELCEWLKFDLGQHWIEPRGRYPQVVNGMTLIDLDANLSFGITIGKAGSFRVVDPANVLTTANLRTIEGRLNRGQLHDDDLLLAEALHLTEGHEPSPSRATLLAAIAVELRTKRLLRTIARDRADMLGLLLENPRDWSMSAHGLFAKAIPTLLIAPLDSAMAGQHKELAKKVQALFTARNAIAHRGAATTRAEARSHVQSAVAAFALMQLLEEREALASQSP